MNLADAFAGHPGLAARASTIKQGITAAAQALRSAPALTAEASRGLDADWRGWLKQHFAHYTTHGFAPRHVHLWTWFTALRAGAWAPTEIEIWARGGAKSTSIELGCGWICERRSRLFVLYVSGTQDQADKHIGAISNVLETLGIARAVNVYGHSKGWRRQQLRTDTGFNVAAFGLDAAARGVKLDEVRPDLICFDDVDARHDSVAVVRKKEEAITQTILPAGASHCAVLFLQNLVQNNSIASRLIDGRADFLLNRNPVTVEPAVLNLAYQRVVNDVGASVYEIRGGEPTWEGQDLAVCTDQINTWGLRAFLREAQHDVLAVEGAMFQREWFLPVPVCPAECRWVRYWDLAATQAEPGTDPDWTVGVLMGEHAGVYYIKQVDRIQGSDLEVERLVHACALDDGYDVPIEIEQEPGASGKSLIGHYQRTVLAGFAVNGDRPTGDKQVRARPLSGTVEAGNVKLLPGSWRAAYLDVMCAFPFGPHDDDVDATSGAYGYLSRERLQHYAMQTRAVRPTQPTGPGGIRPSPHPSAVPVTNPNHPGYRGGRWR